MGPVDGDDGKRPRAALGEGMTESQMKVGLLLGSSVGLPQLLRGRVSHPEARHDCALLRHHAGPSLVALPTPRVDEAQGEALCGLLPPLTP
ncbi:hypothetical protein Fmac_030945 [Flemingia macrophylla]|uniref:Uncharacterized protein n=1 Tax=Flemingia macrophylla TaxID=520843 RepID=A0ABD1L0N0_9FABA